MFVPYLKVPARYGSRLLAPGFVKGVDLVEGCHAKQHTTLTLNAPLNVIAALRPAMVEIPTLHTCLPQVISPRQMQKGFKDVVAALDDLKIDVPEAPGLAATFIARAVVDDILPPSFVGKLPAGR